MENNKSVVLVVTLASVALAVTLVSENTNAYGDTQWAFRRKRSRQDMIAVLMSKRLLALNSGKKVGVYLSNTSGAFDRVKKLLMMRKAARTGLSPMWLKSID